MSVASLHVNPVWPNLGVGLAGVIWGCFWIPARYFDANGLSHGLMSTALFAVTVVVLLPWALWRFRPAAAERGSLLHIAVFAGTAYAFYANSLLLTEVIRALLLFYLTPIWSTVLGIVLLASACPGRGCWRLASASLAPWSYSVSITACPCPATRAIGWRFPPA